MHYIFINDTYYIFSLLFTVVYTSEPLLLVIFFFEFLISFL